LCRNVGETKEHLLCHLHYAATVALCANWLVKLTLGSTTMQLLTHNPKVEGSNPAIGPEIEKMNKKAFRLQH
jgi:hypothetical protein